MFFGVIPQFVHLTFLPPVSCRMKNWDNIYLIDDLNYRKDTDGNHIKEIITLPDQAEK